MFLFRDIRSSLFTREYGQEKQKLTVKTGYTKFGTKLASNASVIQMRKPLISAKVEMRGFCLLRLCPNPRRTLKVCSGNAGSFQRLRDFANR